MITDRIDHVTQIEEFKPVQPPPPSVKIELSPRCNYRCGFCALRTRDKQPKEDMDIDFFKRITKEMVDAGVEEIGCFFLGESFMNPSLLVDSIKYLKSINTPYVFLTSNASLATPKWVKAVMEAGLDSLKWSVNNYDEEQFKNVVSVSPRWLQKSIQNIQQAWEIREKFGYKTKLYASSIQYDGKQKDRMNDFVDRHIRDYVDHHYFLPLYGMSLTSRDIENRIGYKPTHGNMARIDEKTGLPTRDPLPCWSVFREGHVRANGAVSACCFGSDDRFDVGNLYEQSFMDAWNSPKMIEIREAHVRTKTEGPAALKGTMCEVCAVND